MTQTTAETGVDLSTVIDGKFAELGIPPESEEATDRVMYGAGFKAGARWMLRASAQFGGLVPLLRQFVGLLEGED